MQDVPIEHVRDQDSTDLMKCLSAVPDRIVRTSCAAP